MTRDERIAEIKGRRYGINDAAIKEHRCAEYMTYEHLMVFGRIYQCMCRPGHGLGGLFCKQHAKNNPEITTTKGE